MTDAKSSWWAQWRFSKKGEKATPLEYLLLLVIVGAVVWFTGAKLLHQMARHEVFMQASAPVRERCMKEARYTHWFNREGRRAFYVCIVQSKDPQFQQAAAKYLRLDLQSFQQLRPESAL